MSLQTLPRAVHTVDPPLDRIACVRCGQIGVTVIAFFRVTGQTKERCWCTILCAAVDGWPWLRSEPSRPRGRRRCR